jgi:N-hydroxyarylamine O-acetyltransferase
MSVMDLDRYFARIGFKGPAPPTLETLARLHQLHVEHIPFENLSPFLGEPVKLDPASLQAKLVESGRGGYCYEHNLLFSHVLIELGFEVRRLGARVLWNARPGIIPPRTHMLILLRIGAAAHIADVGFGGLTLTAPLRLEAGVEQATPHEAHRLVASGEAYVLEALVAGQWQALYSFELCEQQVADYEVCSWYLCHFPMSGFLTGILAARAAPDRRYALRNTRLAVHHRDGRTEKRFIGDVAEYRELLSGPFAIRLPDSASLDERLAALIAANPEARTP